MKLPNGPDMTVYAELRFLNIAHFFDHFVLLIFPTAVLALHSVWELSYAEALVYGTPAFAMFAIATLPCGWLGDRFGGRALMKVFFAGTGFSLILASLAQTPLQLAIALGAMGAFGAIYHPVATAMIVTLAGENRGRELGTNGVWGNLGVALAAAITAILVSWLGWRAAFWVPGSISLSFGIAYLFMDGLRSDGGRPEVPATRTGRPAKQYRIFLIVAVMALFNGMVFAGVTVALPKLVDERLGGPNLGLASVGAVATAIFFAASFTQMLTGRLIDKVGPKPVLLGTAGIQIPLLLAAALIWGWWLVPIGIGMMLGVFGIVPVASWLLGHYVSAAWRSRAFAAQFMLALGVQALVVPIITTLHSSSGDMTRLFMLLALAAIPVFLAAFWLPERPHLNAGPERPNSA